MLMLLPLKGLNLTWCVWVVFLEVLGRLVGVVRNIALAILVLLLLGGFNLVWSPRVVFLFVLGLVLVFIAHDW